MVRTLSPERRDQYLNAALKLFAERGIQNTTTAEVAREAGTAAGTLFLYFPTRQDLIDGLARQLSREQSGYIHALLDPSLPARETFWVIWSGSLRWLLDHPEAFQVLQQMRDTGVISPAVVAETAMDLGYYYQAVQKGLDEGAVRPYPIELIGAVLYQMIVAVMGMVRAQADPDVREGAIRQGFEIFWNGIKVEAK